MEKRNARLSPPQPCPALPCFSSPPNSGDWMIDRLTISEQLAYERAMGYVAINLDQGIGGKRRSSVRRDSRRAKQ